MNKFLAELLEFVVQTLLIWIGRLPRRLAADSFNLQF